MLNRNIAIGLAMVLLAALPAAADESAEDKLIDDMFGEQIAAAKATPALEDNLAVARDMLIAAYDDAFSAKLRSALAMRVVNMTLGAGTPASTDLASRAVTLADSVQPLDAYRRAELLRDIASRRLATARRARKKHEELKVLAREVILRDLGLVQAAGIEPARKPQAERALNQAKQLAKMYSLSELNKPIAHSAEYFRRASKLAKDLAQAMGRLKSARASGRPAAIRAASIAAGMVHLEHSGDLRAAAKYFAGIDDPRTKPIAAGASFLTAGEVDPATCLDSVEMLTKLAGSLDEPARGVVAETARSMCTSYLGAGPADVPAARGKLLLAKLKVILDKSAADARLAELAKAYGGLDAKIALANDQGIRVVYDFSGRGQLSDWQVPRGTWIVAERTMKLRASRRAAGVCVNKLRFRADRPFKVSFDAMAGHVLEARLRLYRWKSKSPVRTDRFTLARPIATVHAAGVKWSEARHKLREGKLHHFEIISDATGGFVWSVDNIVLYKRSGDAAESNGSFSLELRGESSNRSPLSFRNVVMEGTVLSSPLWAPAAKEPKSE